MGGMGTENTWVAFACPCGFRLAHVPAEVLHDVPRCLGCGRSLRTGSGRVVDVRGFR